MLYQVMSSVPMNRFHSKFWWPGADDFRGVVQRYILLGIYNTHDLLLVVIHCWLYVKYITGVTHDCVNKTAEIKQTKLITLISWWRHQMETFSAFWPFVRGMHRPPVDSPHKGQWRGAFIFSWSANGWANTRDAGDLKHHLAHYDVTVMVTEEIT